MATQVSIQPAYSGLAKKAATQLSYRAKKKFVGSKETHLKKNSDPNILLTLEKTAELSFELKLFFDFSAL